MGFGWYVRAAAGVARHPRLWATALGQTRRLAVPRWWRRAPFLPLPAPEYLRFRLETAYGTEGATPPVEDLLAYLRWCRALARSWH